MKIIFKLIYKKYKKYKKYKFYCHRLNVVETLLYYRRGMPLAVCSSSFTKLVIERERLKKVLKRDGYIIDGVYSKPAFNR
jgi:hypothetical protein